MDVLEGVDGNLLDSAWEWLTPRARTALLRLCHAGAASASAAARREAREAAAAAAAAGGAAAVAAAAEIDDELEEAGARAAREASVTGTFRAPRFRQRARPDLLSAPGLQGREVLDGAFDLLAAFEIQQLGVQVSAPPPQMVRSALLTPAGSAGLDVICSSYSRALMRSNSGGLGGNTGGAASPYGLVASALERRVLRRHLLRAALVARLALLVHDSITGGTRKSWTVVALKSAEAGSHTDSEAEVELPPDVILAVINSADAHLDMSRHAGRGEGTYADAGGPDGGTAAGKEGGFRRGLVSWLRRRRPFGGGGEERQPSDLSSLGALSQTQGRGRSSFFGRRRTEVIHPALPAGAAAPPPAPPLPLPPPRRVSSFKRFALRGHSALMSLAQPSGGVTGDPTHPSASGRIRDWLGGGAAHHQKAKAAAEAAAAAASVGTTSKSSNPSLWANNPIPSLEEAWREVPFSHRVMFHAHVVARTLWMAAMGDPGFWQDGVDLQAGVQRRWGRLGARGAWRARLCYVLRALWLRPMAWLAAFSDVSLGF